MEDYVHDITKQFKSLLDKLKEKRRSLQIYYFYPDRFTNKACISYKLAGNTVLDKTIKKQPRRQEASYYVDFWGSSPEELSELATELKNILLPEGFSCTFEQDLKDINEIYYHKSTRFQTNFDNKLKIIL